jgi:NOL1/NOP2/sun family putative RNA methylase
MKTIDYFKQRYENIIPDFEEFLAAIQKKNPVVLRPNKIKFSHLDFQKSFSKYENLDALQRLEFYLENYLLPEVKDFSLGGSLEHTLGHFYSQNLSSQLAVDCLNPQPGECVLDLCAAPGGKTVLIAEKMQNTGMIVANEIYRNRNIALKANLDRMGIVNCIVTSFNGIEFPGTRQFDKVLLDGPCSAEGTLRTVENPELPFKNDTEFRKGLIRTQQKLILKAYELLKEGGELLYSTCTYAPEENEQIVQYLLDNSQAKIIKAKLSSKNESIVNDVSNGLLHWGDQKFNENMNLTKRVYPHKINTGGFYIAKISK